MENGDSDLVTKTRFLGISFDSQAARKGENVKLFIDFFHLGDARAGTVLLKRMKT